MDHKTLAPGTAPQPITAVLFFVALWLLSACAGQKPPQPGAGMPKVAAPTIFSQKESGRTPPRPLPVHQPTQVSFEADPVLYAALSGDGKTLAYVTEKRGRSFLRLRPRDPAMETLPLKQLEGPDGITAPALSQNAGKVAFVATDHDAKGDIYVLSTHMAEATPRRLTGRDTADGAPAFSPDGSRIYFHRLRPGENLPHLAYLDLDAGSRARGNLQVKGIETLREGAFPAISPDGEHLAFVSFREDSGGDIYVLNLKTGHASPVTTGTARDLYPAWSFDGKQIYFSRFDTDPNKDGRTTPNPNAVIWRVAPGDRNPRAYPLTSETFSAYQPMATPSEILFLSSLKGIGNLWSLPPGGQIPPEKDGKAQMALARILGSRLPREDALAALAYHKVLERFGRDGACGEEAAYEMGKLYQRMGRRNRAAQAYKRTMEDFGDIQPQKALASIRLAKIQTEKAWEAAPTDFKRNKILENALIRIQQQIDAETSPQSDITPPDAARVRARGFMARARLMGDLGRDPASLSKAIRLLDQVTAMADLPPGTKAEALFQKARLNSRMGRASAVAPAYLSIISEYPDTPWADLSVQSIIDIHLSDSFGKNREARVQALARLAETHQTSAPKLAMGALNRMGDEAFEAGEQSRAKRWYREVLNLYEGEDGPPPTQVAAARLALAEILYREELFRQALDLYEKEMAYRPYEDRLHALARAAHIQKSMAAADFLFNLGEVPAAQKIYGDLIRHDPNLVQAHRGYIKCAAAMKTINHALSLYRAQLEKAPDNPVLLYGTGLCLTYLQERKPLEEARTLIEAAIQKQGRTAYFHQTLGYIFEVSETVYGMPEGLENALSSYQKAFFLNNTEQDPQNSADLALNLGNIHFLLGQYGKAFERYKERLESKYPFDHGKTEILFYRRLGRAAFQMDDPAISIDAYTRAIDLIEDRIEPKRASAIMDKLNTFIFDRILTPALKRTKNAEKVVAPAQRQSNIHKALFHATAKHFGPPPDPRWDIYKQAMTPIMAEQKELMGDLGLLITEKKNETLQTLSLMLTRARDALEFPSRMIALKAEMLDRLGLAFQEAGQWNKAAIAFGKAFQLNQKTGKVRNLAANRRSVAYNTYMAAGEKSGKEKESLLKQALKQFRDAQLLLDEYGVVAPEQKKAEPRTGDGRAILNVTLDLALDKTTGSQAAYGFSQNQEKHLVRAFISRIETELGILAGAQAAIERQLLSYGQANAVSHKDLYGVSLLSHRDGQLRFARRQPKKAFQSFQRSAELALKLKNPVSAAINVVNMAWALGHIPEDDPDGSPLSARLTALDRETTRLLKRSRDILDPLVLPVYHNRMGALTLNSRTKNKHPSPERAAGDLARLKRAGVHFIHGLEAFKETGRAGNKSNRKALALEAALQLNAAHTAACFDEPESAKEHAEKALAISGEGLLPQYEWRALALLGDLTTALKVLSSVPLANGGCTPGEIRTSFAPLVSSLIEKEAFEEALNLLEKLSEMERFQRMAPMVWARISPPERVSLLKIFPRLMMLSHLKKDLKRAPKGEKSNIEERIRQEQALLDQADLPNLPALLTRSKALREQLVVLLSLSCEMERLADLATAKSAEESGLFKTRRRKLMGVYTQTLKSIKRLATREGTPGVAALFAPDPVESIDLMESLPRAGHAIRLFKSDPKDNAWTVFVVTSDHILVETRHALSLPSPSAILIYEEPWILPAKITCSVALSATHLVRSVENRKPFKRLVVEIAGSYKLPSDFELTQLPDSTEREIISAALPGAQGLLLGGPVYTAGSVPTRPEEIPVYGPVMGLDQGRNISLFTLFDRLSDVSLAVLPQAAPEEVYTLGHLFSLMGVSTLLLSHKPRKHSRVVEPFFEAYGKNPAHEALLAALKNPRAKGERWISLGYRGMTEKEALELARRRFREYVKKGIASFRKKECAGALILFEKALTVARQVKKLSRYEPQILIYARESAYAAGQYERAVQHARDLAKLWTRKKPDSKDQAEALVKLGLIHARMEQYDRAIPALEEGAEIMANLELEDLQVAALNDLGVVLENATDYDRALERFQSAADIGKSLDKKGIMARQHMRMGRVYDLRMSQYARAKIHYLKAYRLYETLNRTESMAQALLDAGRCDRLMGNFKGAENRYETALKLLDKGEGGPGAENKIMAGILMEQANNHWFQARYQDAFKGQQAVLRMAREHRWTLEQVNSLNTAGLIWWTLGDHPSALRQLKDALESAETLEARRDEIATTLNNMGLVYGDMGDYEEALKALGRALAIDRKINSKWAVAYDLKNLGLIRLRMGRPEKALPLFQEALALARQIGNRINEAKIQAGYGEALMALDRRQEARIQFDRALDLSRQMAIREVEWRALYGLGRLQLKDKNRTEARTLLEASVRVIEGMRAGIKLDQMKDGFITNKMAVYETLVGLLVDMGQDSDAFYVAERSRARNLIDLLGNQRLSLHGAVNQELYDKEKGLKSAMAEYETLVAQASDPHEQAVYRQALNRAKDKHRDLMLEIQLKNPNLASILSVDPLTVSQVQGLLEPGTAILVYYVLPDEILCWFISADRADLFRTPLGRRTLARSVLDYRRTLQNLEPVEAQGKELHEWLLSPLKNRLKAVRTLGIVPHHILHHLSFATLFNGNDYLVDRFPLFSLPSASVLRHTIKNRPEKKNTRVLAVGNPALTNPALALPFAEKEVAAIGWNFPDVTVLTGKKATEGWVVRNISDFGIIHLASHGEFDPVNPLLSSVKLAKDDRDDGDLRASEVFGLNIRAGLVMLSACQTGLGKITSGDDVIGMNRAFLYAGTNAIMSSLWRVSDISTALLVKRFYREYRDQPKAVSLSRAMRHVKNRYPHPGYWGAFVLVGDYR